MDWPPPPERLARVGLVKLGAIGDVVNTLPLVNRLRAGLPRARICWVIGPAAHALVAGHPAVDEFLVIDVRRPRTFPAFLRALRARRLDAAIDLQRIFKSGLLTALSGAPLRLGFDRARTKEASFLFTNHRLPANPRPGVTVAQYLEFADWLGLPPAPVEWRLPLDPWPEDGQELSAAAGRAGPRVALVVGASKPANRWPAERWGALAARLEAEVGARAVLVGGPGDRPLAERALAAARASGGRPLDTVGHLSLRRTAGLLAACDLVVAADTGPLHIAVAVGSPVLSLFGAADPERTGPFGRPDSVVRVGAPCAPCRRRRCPIPGHPCMGDLEVELVLERACEALAARFGAAES